ncbi:hypothetical protein GIY11_01540 [Aerococcaceae bacterium DSM 109653]|uniref:Uncharacterized protein n=1 Tax=Fundicoccus ignavus TaxID=2664442 RepID=A0A844BW63_9LACT|nr:hypothetical protein [Fundicoccus ignavus]MRI80716.1 hypothetical protein [Fundicoccus ignavus]
MRVNIDENAFIKLDQYNHTLVVLEPKTVNHLTKDTSTLREKIIGHYRNAEQALIGLRNYRIAQSEDVLTIIDYYELLREENDRIQSILLSLKQEYTSV